VRAPAAPRASEAEIFFRSLAQATWSTLRDSAPGMRAIFQATLLLQITFQTFTSWFALHATERFGVSPQDVALGLIAWAAGGVIGALPAGYLGVRIGRRNAILAGFALMTVNTYPLFVLMASYPALAFAAVLRVPRGAGETDTGPDALSARACTSSR
jgi:predicted MFS family arabinose efflux permease